VFRRGRAVYEPPPPAAAQQRARRQLATLPETVRRLASPDAYPVWLEQSLYEKRLGQIEATRGNAP